MTEPTIRDEWIEKAARAAYDCTDYNRAVLEDARVIARATLAAVADDIRADALLSDRIDHAAKASSALQTARKQFQAELISGENFTAKLAYAQVHATLALVDQQRIANLIALASSPANIGPLRADIAAALGIEADHE